MTVLITIRQSGMGRCHILVDGQGLPFVDVIVGNSRIVGRIDRVAGLLCNDGHGLDSDHSLQGQVGLVANRWLVTETGPKKEFLLTPKIQQSHR